MTILKRAEKKGQEFLNPIPTAVGDFSTMAKVLPLYLTNKEETEPKVPPGPFRTDAGVYASAPSTGLRVTWFGHSSLLIEIDGVRVLTDPIWEQRASPLEWIGPKRFFAPTMELEALPAIDVVLVSHDHYDHMGAHTLRKLAGLKATARARWVTSLGVGKRLRKLGVEESRITELDWTESVEVAGLGLGESIRITSWPSRHFSGRGILDRFKTLWGSFVLEGPKHRVYFGADSGWWDGFGAIAAQYDRFDLVMLEIGAFHPLWAAIHLGPDGAARAYRAMAEAIGGMEKAGKLLPIHWGLFALALHDWRQPIERLLEVAAEDGIPLWLPEPGRPQEPEIEAEPAVSWWARSVR